MESKLHHNACFHMLRHCGLNERQAMIVSTSCLAVDHSTIGGTFDIVDRKPGVTYFQQRRCVSAYNTDELWKAICESKQVRDKILCFHFNNTPIDFIIREAIKAYYDYDLFTLGIWLHVLMDSYSHQHFTRHPSKINNVELMVKGESNFKHWALNRVRWFYTKPIGHAEALNYPDIFDAIWSFNGGSTWINNAKWFTTCFNRIITEVFRCKSYVNKEVVKSWSEAPAKGRVDFILRHHEWHVGALNTQKFILGNEL